MEDLRVIFLSDWLSNPYKLLLAKCLNNYKVKVEEYRWNFIFLYRNFLPYKSEILHFHTLHPFIVGRSSIGRVFKTLLFITQIILLKLIGTKIVWTVHEWSDKNSGGNRNISPNQAKLIGNFFDAIITHCETTKLDITKALYLEGKGKVFVVPHGNYIGCYANQATRLSSRKTLEIPEENLVFLLFGNIYRYKGVLETIDAFKCLEQKRISLVIAGKPNEQELEQTIKEKIKGYNNILFIPERIPDDKVQIYMNACDCVVVPYKVFTTSGVAILAMSFGRACMAPRIGFFSDMLDDSGTFFYDPNQEEGLVQAMKSTVDKKDKISEMGEHNLNLAEQWNWHYVAEETFKLYQQCVGGEF
ncbi:glycosyltransferase [Lyngbya aestuarii]|uniref:glycosyltransferase n=1 Tax=Lyngbya aestuarii TaxID=118322 RepID=UPI00403DD3B8